MASHSYIGTLAPLVGGVSLEVKKTLSLSNPSRKKLSAQRL